MRKELGSVRKRQSLPHRILDYLLARLRYSFVAAVLATGAALVSSPEWMPWLLAWGTEAFGRKADLADLDLSVPLWAEIVTRLVGILLIAARIGLWFLLRADAREQAAEARCEKKARRDAERTFYADAEGPLTEIFPLLESEKHSADPRYRFFLPLELKTGGTRIAVTHVEAHRYEDGCVCLNGKPRLIDARRDREIGIRSARHAWS